jgi:hypothetical protein
MEQTVFGVEMSFTGNAPDCVLRLNSTPRDWPISAFAG